MDSEIEGDILLAAQAAVDDLKKAVILGWRDDVWAATCRACNRYQLDEHSLKKVGKIVEATKLINGGWADLARTTV